MIKIMLDKICRPGYNSLTKRVTGARPWQTRVARVSKILRSSTHNGNRIVTLYLGLSLVVACIDCWLFGVSWEMLAGWWMAAAPVASTAIQADASAERSAEQERLVENKMGLPVTPGQAAEDYARLGSLAQSGIEAAYAQNPNNAINAQQGLLAQLQAQSMGQGPNPALQQLMMSTNQNAAQTAGLMASQRGGGANPALMGRSIAQQGGALNQQAAGQGALMQAQQQLAAQNALGQFSGQLMNQRNQAMATAGDLSMARQQVGGQQNQILAALNQQKLAREGQSEAAWMGLAGSAMQGAGALAGGISGGMKKAHGGTIPGKALVPGDSEENDVVRTLLSPGEIVVPRSYASDPKAAAAFAHACALFNTKKGE